MKRCFNCNQQVEEHTTTCPHCGTSFVVNEEKKPKEWPWGIIGVLCPLLGLILMIIWKDSEPQRVNALKFGTILGVVLWIIVVIPLFIVLKVLAVLLGLVF